MTKLEEVHFRTEWKKPKWRSKKKKKRRIVYEDDDGQEWYKEE